MDRHQLAPCLFTAKGEVWLSSSQQNFHLLVKNSHKLGLTKLKRFSTETRGGRVLGCSSWGALVKLLSLIIGEVKTTPPVTLASLDEANLLSLPPSASLALESAGSEAATTSLLAHNGA